MDDKPRRACYNLKIFELHRPVGLSPLLAISMTSQLNKKGEAWSARFSEPLSELVQRYTSSVFF